MKKTLILGEVFYPEDFLINDLAKKWKLDNRDFEVLTRTPSYPFGKVFKGYKNRIYRTEELNGVVVHRVPVIQGYQKSTIIKILNYFAFMFWSILTILFIGKRFDKVFIYQTGPLTLAFAGIILKKVFGAKVIIWTQDLWPETVYAFGIKKNFLLSSILDSFVKWIYKNSDHIFVSCEGFIERIHKYVPNKEITFIPNWSLMNYEPQSKIILPGKFNFSFAGNIGKVQNLNNVVKGFSLFVQNNTDCCLNIIGDGSYLEELKELVTSENIPNINFTGRIPVSAMSDYYEASDVLIISLIDVPLYEIMIPSKFQTYLSVGKPIFSMLKGEVNSIVEKYGLGISASPNDIHQIAETFNKLSLLSNDALQEISKQSKILSDSIYNRDKIIENIDKVLWNKI